MTNSYMIILCLLVFFAMPSYAENSNTAALQTAAEKGDARAQFKLGEMYRNGDGVMRDYVVADKWYQKAADQGYAAAQNRIGGMYENGRGGVTIDYAAAMKWYRKSADQGDARAQFNIGWMYERGHGVKQDWEEAYFWYLLADKSGFNFSSGNAYAAAAYKAVGMSLTPEQINVVKQRVQEWTSTHITSIP
jgi:TPR repeat protein